MSGIDGNNDEKKENDADRDGDIGRAANEPAASFPSSLPSCSTDTYTSPSSLSPATSSSLSFKHDNARERPNPILPLRNYNNNKNTLENNDREREQSKSFHPNCNNGHTNSSNSDSTSSNTMRNTEWKTRHRRRHQHHPCPNDADKPKGTKIEILSAAYGPAEGRRLLNGDWSCSETSRIPHERDVAPFLRALLVSMRMHHDGDDDDDGDDDRDDDGKLGMERNGNNGTDASGGGGNRRDDENHQDRQVHRRMNVMDIGERSKIDVGHRSASAADVGDDDTNEAREWDQGGIHCNCSSSGRHCPDGERGSDSKSSGGGGSKNFIPIMDGKSMNVMFGDPCPGTTKRLRIHYVFCDDDDDGDDDEAGSYDDDENYDNDGIDAIGIDMKLPSKKRAKRKNAHREICRSTFAEHERVVLRRNIKHYEDDDDDEKLKEASVEVKPNRKQDEDEETSSLPREMGPSRSIGAGNGGTGGLTCALSWGLRQKQPQEIHVSSSSVDNGMCVPPTMTNAASESPSSTLQQSMTNGPANDTLLSVPAPQKWHLRSSTSEIVLPIILPFLDVKQLALCQLVCKVWLFVVRDWGVAQTVDVNDPSFPNFTRSFLRGIMAHSYSSLHSLFLNDFHELAKSDLHPAIPHLRKLRALDVSRCDRLDDETLLLLSQHVGETLEILYMKGLRRVSDEGLVSICLSCHKLRVLEISNVPITDESGLAIGENLHKLEALYMRDNYLLTNRSVDVITKKCTKLTQLTLWGCTRLHSLSFGDVEGSSKSVAGGGLASRIVMLNLWGCLNLRDEAALALGATHNLRSLIVSECHRLTDTFVITLASKVPHILYLYLRYCRRLTDASVDAISNGMQNLYSLDLSFCNKVTPGSLASLLESHSATLSELKLFSCRQLDIHGTQLQRDQPRNVPVGRAGGVGRLLLNALRNSGGEHNLSVLDVRECGDPATTAGPNRVEDDVFIRGMSDLKFEQKVPSFFSRPARWNRTVQRRLMEQIAWDGACDN